MLDIKDPQVLEILKISTGIQDTWLLGSVLSSLELNARGQAQVVILGGEEEFLNIKFNELQYIPVMTFLGQGLMSDGKHCMIILSDNVITCNDVSIRVEETMEEV